MKTAPIIDRYWLVGRRATVRVLVHEGIVIQAAPLVRCFTGQSIHRLMDWFGRKFGPFELEHDIMQVSENKAKQPPRDEAAVPFAYCRDYAIIARKGSGSDSE